MEQLDNEQNNKIKENNNNKIINKINNKNQIKKDKKYKKL